MAVPPPFSTLSAATELLVTAAVAWFFYQAFRRQSYRFGIMTAALVYETVFNIAYMVSRLSAHEGTESEPRPGWYIGFIAFHGLLSLVMFVGLVALVIWAYMERRAGEAHPLGRHPRFSAVFLALWGVSILSGELIYGMYWLELGTSV